MTSTFVKRIGSLAGLGLVASVGLAVPAGAQEGAFMRDLLGSIGILPPERPEIQYRERAPLVLPPKMELRSPAEPGASAASNPQWPNDPTVAAARRREADARTPITELERRRMQENNPRVSAEELRAGRRAGASAPTTPQYRYGDNSRDEYWVRPELLRSQGRKTDTGPSGAAPARQALTDPPDGFRHAVSGQARRNFDPVVRQDEADPKAYIAEQNRRR